MHSFYLYLYCQILVVVFVSTRVHRILYETAHRIVHVGWNILTRGSRSSALMVKMLIIAPGS